MSTRLLLVLGAFFAASTSFAQPGPQALREHLLGVAPLSGPALLAADLNADGAVDSADLLQSTFNPAPSGNFEVTGHYGGRVSTVAVSGGLVYMGQGPYLRAFDPADPAHPALIGEIMLPSIVDDIAIQGNLACVGSESGRVMFVDISNPAAPALLSRANTGTSSAVALQGDFAYVVDFVSSITIINISNPSAPQIVAYAGSGYIDVAANGTDLYCVKQIVGMDIFDISTPASPLALSSATIGSFLETVAVGPTAVWIADSNGIKSLNLTNPFAVTVLGSASTPAQALGLAFDGDIVYVATGDSGLQIFDATDPAAPVKLGAYEGPGSVKAVAAGGDGRVFAADERTGLRIIDASDPAGPVLAGAVASPGFVIASSVFGSNLAVADPSYGAALADISGPADPVHLSTFSVGNASLWELLLSGTTLYLAAGDLGVQVLNVVNPAQPVRIGGFTLEDSNVKEVVLNGSLLYLADRNLGIQILNVENPAVPALLGSYDTPDSATGVAVSGTTAYIADGMTGLMIFDIANPAAPTLLSTYNTPDDALKVAVSGGTAYVSDTSSLQILDVSNPLAPFRVREYRLPADALSNGAYRHAVVQGSYLYVSGAWGENGLGLGLLNVANPAVPAYIGGYAPPAFRGGIHATLANGLVYLSSEVGGLFVLRDTGN